MTMLDEYNYKLRRNLNALDTVHGYLATISEVKKESDSDEYVKTAGKQLACEKAIEYLQSDLNRDPIDILEELKSDMDYEMNYAFERGLIESSIIFNASSVAYEEILYLLL